MRKLFILPLLGFIVAGLAVAGASWWGLGSGPSGSPVVGHDGNILMVSKGGSGGQSGCSCKLCHEMHGGKPGLLKEHPTPKSFPLDCFDCHLPHPLVDEPVCFSCHRCDHTGTLTSLDCFDCHGPHNQGSAPDFSNERDCFQCHDVS